MIGLESGIVKLAPHMDVWAQLFAEEKVRLEAAVGPHILDIQHVGSTAIPGIPTKPIIDIAIAVTNFEAAHICIAPIEQLGYVYKGEYGLLRRHYFVKGNPRTHHLHMNEIGSQAWQNHIRFRDYPQQHPEIAQAYAALKTRLAGQYQQDRERYLQEKAPFIKEVLRLVGLPTLFVSCSDDEYGGHPDGQGSFALSKLDSAASKLQAVNCKPKRPLR